LHLSLEFSIFKTKSKSKKLLITGGVFGVSSLALLIGGGIRTAYNFPFEGDIFKIGPLISMSLGGGLAAIYLPALIKGSIDHKKSKKRLMQLCKEF
jgi:hypothetical protein